MRKYNGAILFIYIVQEGYGIAAKVRKIEQALTSADYRVYLLGLIAATSMIKRVMQLVKWQTKIFWNVLTKEYDVIFIRHSYYLIFVYMVILLRGKRIQMEINTKDVEELKSMKKPLRACLTKIALTIAFKSATRVHAVTEELVRYYQKIFPKVNFTYNPNFVIDEYYEPTTKCNTGEYINIIFLGDTNQKWQGMDQFIERVVMGNGWLKQNCILHIAGTASANLEKIIYEKCLKETVHIHGYLEGSAKRKLLDEMDIGLGSFNLAEKAMIEATPIKTAEYLYSGLPVIIGYRDTRLLDTLPFVLTIDIKSESHVLQEKVNKFMLNVRNNQDLSRQAHEYAAANMLVGNYVRKIIEG